MRTCAFYCLFIYGIVSSCSQNESVKQKQLLENNVNALPLPDTNKIAILSIDTTNQWLFEDAKTFQLTKFEIQEAEAILLNSVNENNRIKDTAGPFIELIDLVEYKRQYVPYITSTGEKKVFINCFCNDDFEYWNKVLVQVEDGGACFFNVTANLTTGTHEKLFINPSG